MYIGIYDQDIFDRIKFLPNLETMQISALHKSKKDIVELILDLNDIIKFDKIYYVKRHNDRKFNADLIANPKVECVGLGFTNDKYTGYPEFEKMKPDVHIYNRFIRWKKTFTKADQARINHLTKYGYGRITFNGELDESCAPTTEKVYLYDNNIINVPGALEFLNEKNYQKVKFATPVYCDDFQKICQWADAQWNHGNNEYVFTGIVSNEEFAKYYNSPKKGTGKITYQIHMTGKEGATCKHLFEIWINRILFVYTRGREMRLQVVGLNRLPFYNELFHNLMNWNNKRYWGGNFENFFKSKYKNKRKISEYVQLFDILIEKNYNINRMVKIIPKSYKEKVGVWNNVG